MKAWIFVEGPSDVTALAALFADWRGRLRAVRKGLEIIHLQDKGRYLRKIGARAAEKLYANPLDVVVGLPDLYPLVKNGPAMYCHSTLPELKTVQKSEVQTALVEKFHVAEHRIDGYLERFHPTALKHDLEMLLLAAEPHLKATLQTGQGLDGWRHPVEEQNFDRPPKRIIEDLWRRHSPRKHAYRDTIHAQQVLKRASGDIRSLLYNSNGQLECPVFKATLDWLGAMTEIPAY